MVSIVVPVSYFIDYVITFILIIIELCSKVILEKEQSQDGEHDEELDKDDDPKPFSDGHIAKTVVVEVKDPVEDVALQWFI